MVDERGEIMPRGGARKGAGRKPEAGEARKQRWLRATDEEWEKIKKFADKIKKENKAK